MITSSQIDEVIKEMKERKELAIKRQNEDKNSSNDVSFHTGRLWELNHFIPLLEKLNTTGYHDVEQFYPK